VPFFEIIRSGTQIDFIGRWKLCVIVSIAAILAGVAGIFVNGIKLGIDFAGGSEIQVKFAEGVPADESQIREIMSAFPHIDNLSVVRFGGANDNEFLIQFKGSIEEVDEGDPAEGDLAKKNKVDLMMEALSNGIGQAYNQRVEYVGPKVGDELRRDGALSLFWSSVFILIYVAFRFSSRFAPGAVVAVIHDILVTASILVILGMEFDLRILAAMLAILGYSLNDTIIIYDRIRENLETHTTVDMPSVLNLSVNQTLSRTVLTSGTTMIAVAALWALGGEVIRPFSFAMLIGVLVGTYSSIFIASPLLLVLEDRFGGPKGGAKKKKQKKSVPEYGVV